MKSLICTNLVKSEIVKNGLDNHFISEKLQIAYSTWMLKLNGERPLKVKEMFMLQDILKIPDEKLREFFLN